jgi:lysozyme
MEAPSEAAGRGSSVLGIDVSHHQGTVDWKAVAAEGIVFAFVKATEGVTFVDKQFAINWAAMKDAGILRGAYHFFRPARPVKDQVDSFLRTLGTLDERTLPPVLDIEEARTQTGLDEWQALPLSRRAPVVLEWLESVADRAGRQPILYTRRGFIRNCMDNPGGLTKYPLWIAHYTANPEPAVPEGWPSWLFWQHSEKGRVKGIQGPVDLNRFNGELAELLALAGAGVPAAEAAGAPEDTVETAPAGSPEAAEAEAGASGSGGHGRRKKQPAAGRTPPPDVD